MVKIFTINNPHNPQDNLEQREIAPGTTLKKAAGVEVFEQPWLAVCYLDGKRYFPKREEWANIDLKHGDVVYLMPHVGGPITILVIAIVAIAAVAVALLSIAQPPNVADSPEPDPVFSIQGQKNQNRLGNPIEDGFGRVRMWPSYATRPYNQFYGNDQFQFQLFCLGQGSWEIEDIFIEDTQINNFSEVEFAIYQPGELVTLFPNNVETSVEVAGLELYGPNEPEYVGSETVGPFVANQVNTETNRLEIDIVLPRGLYYSNDNGGLSAQTVTATFEYQEIDGNGDAIGAWQVLEIFTRTLATNTPQRFTIAKEVPNGRYQVRAARNNNANTSHRAGGAIQWQSLRAFLPSTTDFGDVTMLAVKARATNNLNDQSSNRVNVVGTRKLPIWDPVTKTIAAVDDVTARVATRSPIWAMVQIMRAKYGGKLTDPFIDLAFLHSEAVEAENSNIFFDWIYDQKTTVWEALKLPAFVNRSIPMLNGSQVTAVRDRLQTLPTFFISEDNTIEGSFELSKQLYDLNPNDGLEVEYTDPDTFKPETVLCRLGDEQGINPKRIKLQGITSRQKAFELGMYSWAKENYERTQITLSTGLEGYTPTYGDLVRVSSNVPLWGQSGFILAVSADGLTIDLDREIEINPIAANRLAIRGRFGQDLGPFTVVQGVDASQLVSATPIDLTQISLLEGAEMPYFIFGPSNDVGRVARIVNIQPADNGTVKLEMVENDIRRFSDFGTAPALVAENLPPITPLAPNLEGLNVELLPNTTKEVFASWDPAVGATNYLVETSIDGFVFSQILNTTATSTKIEVDPGNLWVRVAAVGAGIGPFSVWNGQVGQATGVPNDIQGLQLSSPFTGLSAQIEWQELATAESYKVEILTEDETQTLILRDTQTTTQTTFTLDFTEAQIANAADRNITFRVFGVNALGDSENAAIVVASNSIPPALGNVSQELLSTNGTLKTYRLSWDPSPATDLFAFRVWSDATQGFVPGVTNQVWQGLANSTDITVDTAGGSAFWTVAAVDVWESPGDVLNYSTQLEIS